MNTEKEAPAGASFVSGKADGRPDVQEVRRKRLDTKAAAPTAAAVSAVTTFVVTHVRQAPQHA
jgi:hypothetical protein